MNLNVDVTAITAAYGQYFIVGTIFLILIILGIVRLIKRRKNKMNEIEREALSEKAKQIWKELQDFEAIEQTEMNRLKERFKTEKKQLQDKYDYLYDKLGWRQ